jgi:hypothetical protein
MKNIFFLWICLFLLQGCKKSNLYTRSSISNFPVTQNSSWTYVVNDTVFSFQQAGIALQYNMVVTVAGNKQLPGGINAAILVYTYPDYPGAIADTNFVFQQADTIFFAANILPVINIVRRYVVPFHLQQSWKYTDNSVHDVIVDSQYTVSAGPYEFNSAFHLQGYPGRPDEIFGLEEWIADGVGVVKRYFNNVQTTNNPYRHITMWSLINYHIE